MAMRSGWSSVPLDTDVLVPGDPGIEEMGYAYPAISFDYVSNLLAASVKPFLKKCVDCRIRCVFAYRDWFYCVTF